MELQFQMRNRETSIWPSPGIHADLTDGAESVAALVVGFFGLDCDRVRPIMVWSSSRRVGKR